MTLPDLLRVKVKTVGDSWGGTCWFSGTGEVRRVLSSAGTRGWTSIEPDCLNSSTTLRVVLKWYFKSPPIVLKSFQVTTGCYLLEHLYGNNDSPLTGRATKSEGSNFKENLNNLYHRQDLFYIADNYKCYSFKY